MKTALVWLTYLSIWILNLVIGVRQLLKGTVIDFVSRHESWQHGVYIDCAYTAPIILAVLSLIFPRVASGLLACALAGAYIFMRSSGSSAINANLLATEGSYAPYIFAMVILTILMAVVRVYAPEPFRGRLTLK